MKSLLSRKILITLHGILYLYRFYHCFMCSESWYHMITGSVDICRASGKNISVPNFWSHQKCNGQWEQLSHSNFLGVKITLYAWQTTSIMGEVEPEHDKNSVFSSQCYKSYSSCVKYSSFQDQSKVYWHPALKTISILMAKHPSCSQRCEAGKLMKRSPH